MNLDVSGNSKLFWKEVINENVGGMESYNRMRDENGRLELGEDEG